MIFRQDFLGNLSVENHKKHNPSDFILGKHSRKVWRKSHDQISRSMPVWFGDLRYVFLPYSRASFHFRSHQLEEVMYFSKFLGCDTPHSRWDAVTMIEMQFPHKENTNKTYSTNPKLDFSGRKLLRKGCFYLISLHSMLQYWPNQKIVIFFDHLDLKSRFLWTIRVLVC